MNSLLNNALLLKLSNELITYESLTYKYPTNHALPIIFNYILIIPI